MKILDISPRISPRLAVFPGDQPFERKISLSFSKGDHLELSSVKTTLHLGAHADSVGHYSAKGGGIEARPLSYYIGPAQVIHIRKNKRERIGLADIKGVGIRAPRVLFCTESFPNPEEWTDDFVALEPSLIDALADQGVCLLGIDTPSVDLSDSKDLPAHAALLANQMAVLEGLVLGSVVEGLYTLVALPLPIEGGDASPVRAVLLEGINLPDPRQNPVLS